MRSLIKIPEGWNVKQSIAPSGVVDVILSNPAYKFSPILGSDHSFDKALSEAVRQVTNMMVRSPSH
jgi:hypothetical protein